MELLGEIFFTVRFVVCCFQGAHMQTSIRTTWSTQPTTTGSPVRSQSPARRLRAPTRTATRRRRSCCWCATGPAPDSRGAGPAPFASGSQLRPIRSKLSKPRCSHDACRFGNPFILYLERTVTWDTLQTEILEKMRHLLRPGAIVQVNQFKYEMFVFVPL